MTGTDAIPMLCEGVVRHRRLRPAEHAFRYPTSLLLLPMRSLRAGRGGEALARKTKKP